MPALVAPDSLAVCLSRARADLDAGKAADAEALLREELVREPNSADVHFLLGFALFREIQTHAADAANVSKTAQHNAFLKLREANARASLAQFTEGARFRAPSAFDLKIVALDYVLLDDQPDADRWLTKSLAWDPSDAQGWYYEGRIRYKQAHYADAVEAFQRALQLQPQDVKAEDNLGLALKELGRQAEAMIAYRQAIAWARAQGLHDDGPWVDLGILLRETGRAQEAVTSLAEAAAMNADDLRAHRELAEAYRSLGKWPEAEAQLKMAVALSPDSASLHFMLGQVLKQNHQLGEATVELQRSAELKAGEDAPARMSDRGTEP